MVDHVDQAVGRADQDVMLGLAGLGPLCFHLRILRLLTSVADPDRGGKLITGPAGSGSYLDISVFTENYMLRYQILKVPVLIH